MYSHLTRIWVNWLQNLQAAVTFSRTYSFHNSDSSAWEPIKKTSTAQIWSEIHFEDNFAPKFLKKKKNTKKISWKLTDSIMIYDIWDQYRIRRKTFSAKPGLHLVTYDRNFCRWISRCSYFWTWAWTINFGQKLTLLKPLSIKQDCSYQGESLNVLTAF